MSIGRDDLSTASNVFLSFLNSGAAFPSLANLPGNHSAYTF